MCLYLTSSWRHVLCMYVFVFNILLVPCMHALVFNVPPTSKVICRLGHSLKSHPTDCWIHDPWFKRGGGWFIHNKAPLVPSFLTEHIRLPVSYSIFVGHSIWISAKWFWIMISHFWDDFFSFFSGNIGLCRYTSSTLIWYATWPLLEKKK